MPMFLEGTADAESLRYRFALLTRPADRREFLREVNSNPRLAQLWSETNATVIAPPADYVEQAETFEAHDYAHECANSQRLFRHITGQLNTEDWRELAEARHTPVPTSTATPFPFSFV